MKFEEIRQNIYSPNNSFEMVINIEIQFIEIT